MRQTGNPDTFTVKSNRHAVALKDFRPGDVLGMETPSVHFLYSERLLSNCSLCVKPVVIPVPCYGCAEILFCSGKCR